MREAKNIIKTALRNIYGFAPLPKEISIKTIQAFDYFGEEGRLIIADINGKYYKVEQSPRGEVVRAEQMKEWEAGAELYRYGVKN